MAGRGFLGEVAGEVGGEGVALFRGERPALGLGECGHERAFLAVEDPLVPIHGGVGGGTAAEGWDHGSAVGRVMADAAGGGIELLAGLAPRGFHVAARAIIAKDGLPVGGGDLEVAGAVGVALELLVGVVGHGGAHHEREGSGVGDDGDGLDHGAELAREIHGGANLAALAGGENPRGGRQARGGATARGVHGPDGDVGGRDVGDGKAEDRLELAGRDVDGLLPRVEAEGFRTRGCRRGGRDPGLGLRGQTGCMQQGACDRGKADGQASRRKSAHGVTNTKRRSIWKAFYPYWARPKRRSRSRHPSSMRVGRPCGHV